MQKTQLYKRLEKYRKAIKDFDLQNELNDILDKIFLDGKDPDINILSLYLPELFSIKSTFLYERDNLLTSDKNDAKNISYIISILEKSVSQVKMNKKARDNLINEGKCLIDIVKLKVLAHKIEGLECLGAITKKIREMENPNNVVYIKDLVLIVNEIKKENVENKVFFSEPKNMAKLKKFTSFIEKNLKNKEINDINE